MVPRARDVRTATGLVISAILIATACGPGRSRVPTASTAVRVVVRGHEVLVDEDVVVRLVLGAFRDAETARRYEVPALTTRLLGRCRSKAEAIIEVPDELRFETLFALSFTTRVAGCVTVTFRTPTRTVAHAFPPTHDGISVPGEAYGGERGLVARVGDDQVRIHSEAAGVDLVELPWPLRESDVETLRAAVVAEVRAGERTIVIDAPEDATAGSVLRLVDALAADATGAPLLPERAFRGPGARPRAEPHPHTPPIMDDGLAGPNFDVTIDSQPAGARVWRDGTLLGVTPLRVTAPGQALPWTLRLERPGFAPCEVTVDGMSSRLACTLNRVAP